MKYYSSQAFEGAFATPDAPPTTAAARKDRVVSWLLASIGPDETRPWWMVYAFAVAAIAAATLLRLSLDPLLENRAPYGPCLIATVFVAWRYGMGPAFFVLVGGAVLARLLFEDPQWSFAVLERADHAPMITSLLLGSLTVLFSESLRIAARSQARLARQAEEANARKDQFLATLSHELRTPLAPIRLALYQLDHLDAGDPRAAQLRQLIDNQVQYLVHLVNDLLDLSRITRGKIELQPKLVKLGEIVDAALNLVRPLIQEKSHDLQVSLPTSDVYLNADPVRLTQVLVNLLNNAAKYTDDGGRIWLGAETEGQQVVIRVRDTGVGIAAEMQPLIFDLFQQGHPSIEKSQGGLGIGLTLARTLLSMHGGDIQVSSPGPGMGSLFTVRLPIAAPLAEATPGMPSEVDLAADQAAPAEGVRGPLRVLVVDDSAVTAKALADVLNLWNLKVEVSHDAFSALETASRFRPDVVLTDLGLPRMNGYQLAEELRRQPGMERTVLIAISGYGQAADRQRSQAAGFVCHLVKPVDVTELEKAIALVPPSVAVSASK